jgi:serine acetyltransferase
MGTFSNIGLGLSIAHAKNITIGRHSNIGENVRIFHGVTLGVNAPRWDDSLDCIEAFPQIGNNCTLCVNASILGGVKVAEGTIVAAGAVLLTDTEPNSVYAGVPAKRISNPDI